MNVMFALLDIAILVSLPSIATKIGALLIRARVRWSVCFAYGAIAAISAIIWRGFVIPTFGSVPFSVGIVIGPGFHLGFGSWYFSSRAMDERGKPIGIQGGLKLMLVFLALMAAFLFLSSVLSSTLLRMNHR